MSLKIRNYQGYIRFRGLLNNFILHTRKLKSQEIKNACIWKELVNEKEPFSFRFSVPRHDRIIQPTGLHFLLLAEVTAKLSPWVYGLWWNNLPPKKASQHLLSDWLNIRCCKEAAVSRQSGAIRQLPVGDKHLGRGPKAQGQPGGGSIGRKRIPGEGSQGSILQLLNILQSTLF